MMNSDIQRWVSRAILVSFMTTLMMTNPQYAEDASTSATKKLPQEVKTTSQVKAVPAVPKKNITVATTPTAHGFYQVKPGDQLWKIAERHATTIQELLQLNPTIKNQHLIYVGQKIKLPVKVTSTAVTPSKTVATGLPTAKEITTPPAITKPPVAIEDLKTEPVVFYDDGVYRGTFMDSGSQQVGIELTMTDQIIKSISYRTLSYKGVDYTKPTDDRSKALKSQYYQLLQSLAGKTVAALETLYEPANIVTTQKVGEDTLSGATVRSGKVRSAVKDALLRGVYKYTGSTSPSTTIYEKNYADGTYRGVYLDNNQQQVGIEFKIKEQTLTDLKFRTLTYSTMDYLSEKENKKIMALRGQYESLLHYLSSKAIKAVADLYKPGNIAKTEQVGTDTMTGATLRSGKIISAINDALLRGPYSK